MECQLSVEYVSLPPEREAGWRNAVRTVLWMILSTAETEGAAEAAELLATSPGSLRSKEGREPGETVAISLYNESQDLSEIG